MPKASQNVFSGSWSTFSSTGNPLRCSVHLQKHVQCLWQWLWQQRGHGCSWQQRGHGCSSAKARQADQKLRSSEGSEGPELPGPSTETLY